MPEPAEVNPEVKPEVKPEVVIPEWAQKIEDNDLKTAVSKFDSPEKLLSTIGIKQEEKDWRDGAPEDLKKTADRFTSRDDALRAIVAFQKREGQVRVPGKDASEDEQKAFRKAIGVPDKPESYGLITAGTEEDIKAVNETWSKRFHELNIPKDTAKLIMDWKVEERQAELKTQIEADKSFAKSQEDALRTEWKGDEYDKNRNIANRAFAAIAERANIDLDVLTKIETKDGRMLMDRSEMLKLFAIIGREMDEGTLGGTITDSERETIDDQISNVRKQIQEAQDNRDSKRANMLYQREQALISKRDGNKPIVGSQGRAA